MLLQFLNVPRVALLSVAQFLQNIRNINRGIEPSIEIKATSSNRYVEDEEEILIKRSIRCIALIKSGRIGRPSIPLKSCMIYIRHRKTVNRYLLYLLTFLILSSRVML